MRKSIIKFPIFIISLIYCCCNAYAAPVIVGSPEGGGSGPSGPPPSSCSTTCNPGQVQDPTSCACSCPSCSSPRLQDSSTCACSCPTVCPVSQIQDPTSCACSCPTTCTAPLVQNTITCACSCPGTCAAPKNVQDPATCACSCPATCTAPKTVQNPDTCACSCPACSNVTVIGQIPNPVTCSCACPSGQSVCTNTNPDKCVTTCVSPKVFDASCSGCVCPSTAPVDTNGHCCPLDKVYEVGRCRTPCAGTTPYRWSDGRCYNCEIEGQTKSGGICKCPEGEGPYDGVCIPCPNGTVYFRGVCEPCSVAGQGLGANGKCRCPSGETLIADYGCIAGDCILSFSIWGSGNGPDGGGGILDQYSKTRKMPSCLNSIVTSARNLAGVTRRDANGYADDSVASSIAFSLGRSSRSPDGTYYFDKNCNILRNTDGFRTCNTGSYRYYQSPVVLLWDKLFTVENLNKDVRLVPFPIDPSQSGKLVEWKASSSAPLLVYDPTGEGKITNGYQLFGNWTFGPKKMASLAPSVTAGEKLWNNGFEALSKLDSNYDGEISGIELEQLSLWFDDNRNGISESGEVRRLSAVGVKKLFYRGYENNDAAHAIVLHIGFERVRDGKIEQGTMVDWFADSVTSELEYAQKAMVSSAFGKEVQTSQEIKTGIQIDKSELLAYKQGAALIKGLWQWTSQSDKIAASGGIFLIKDNQDGTISGLTMVELPIVTSFDATSLVSSVAFDGKAKLEKDGSVTFSFALNKKSGSDLKSTAKVDGAGESMIGSSKGTIENKAASTKISYPWTASRFK